MILRGGRAALRPASPPLFHGRLCRARLSRRPREAPVRDAEKSATKCHAFTIPVTLICRSSRNAFTCMSAVPSALWTISSAGEVSLKLRRRPSASTTSMAVRKTKRERGAEKGNHKRAGAETALHGTEPLIFVFCTEYARLPPRLFREIV